MRKFKSMGLKEVPPDEPEYVAKDKAFFAMTGVHLDDINPYVQAQIGSRIRVIQSNGKRKNRFGTGAEGTVTAKNVYTLNNHRKHYLTVLFDSSVTAKLIEDEDIIELI